MDGNQRERDNALLDAALGSYVSAEPRDGLEGRVLARVGSEGKRIQSWIRGLWIGSGLLAALLFCAFFTMHPLKQKQSMELRTVAYAGNEGATISTLKQAPPKSRIRLEPKLRPTRFRESTRRLVTIPSRPFRTLALSEQERTLLRLAATEKLTAFQSIRTPIVPKSIDVSSIVIRPLNPLTTPR